MKKNSTNYVTKMLALTVIAFMAMLETAFCQVPAPDFDVFAYTMAVSPGQQVKFRVPKDIRSGDMITGTVVETLLPYSPTDSFPYTNIDAGKTARSSSTLEGMVIEIDGKQTRINNRFVSFLVPAGLASIPFLLKNSAGEVIERGQIPVGIMSSSIPNTVPQQFVPDAVSQPGQTLRIAGNFDGNAANTNISLNGRAMETIAESPRETFTQVSENATAGVSNISIEENNVKEEHKINIARLDLSAPKTNLLRGQKTTINATVSGLEGLNNTNINFTLRLENLSPQTISFLKEGGNVIERDINSGDVKNGQYEFSTKIIALTSGVFTISANITGPKKDEKDPCKEAYEKEWASIIQQEQEGIKRCNETKGSGNDDCLLKAAAIIKDLKNKCQDAYIKCLKNK